MIDNRNLQRLSQLYLYTAREIAQDDMKTAQTVTGLPADLLSWLRDADLNAIANATEAVPVLSFQPRLPHHLLSRLLKSPAEVNDAAVMIGVKTDASLTD